MTRPRYSAATLNRLRPGWAGSTFASLAFALFLANGFAPAARAGGPRFVGGQAHGNRGQPLVWATSNLQYYTDPGDLSAGVTHAQADAMVAAAAAVWNVPTSSIALSQGGELAEHVSSANSYLQGKSVVFPADVLPANEANIPVAVIYDSDGSVTDLLLGSGASNPVSCRQNAVVGDVDDLGANNAYDAIHHATLVLNGRCVGPAPEQLTQMQYQLARAFGRILGLSWSQTNDNVFTGKTPATPQQLAFWPLMHPIDVICGLYTYQCMTNPFTLRVDDLNTLSLLYPVSENNVPTGKQASDDDALRLSTDVTFPTGQGMAWVNYTTHRFNADYMETWQTTSGVSGQFFQQALTNPVTQVTPSPMGTADPWQEGLLELRRVPMNGVSNLYLDAEAINPLYTGGFSLGMYARPPATPSGHPPEVVGWSAYSYGDQEIPFGSPPVSDAASACAPGADGTETAPAAFDPSGFQTGLLCGWGHFSWWGISIAAGHSWTFEVTATDETGATTLNKVQPILGAWNVTDAPGTLPTVASMPVPFNSMAMGVTQVQMSAGNAARNLRVAVADQYGAGRPDFTYTARLLYAASISPIALSAGGGSLTITGSGFRHGNGVTVNGVAATVVSWTPTQIVALAPSMAAAKALLGHPVAVAVTDASTGGSTRINAALNYTNTADMLQKISAPASLLTSVPAATPFAVRVLAPDGVTGVAGATVRFAVTAGSASLSACGGTSPSSCAGITDSTGLVQTFVTATAGGNITLTATEISGGATVQVTVTGTDPARSVTIPNPTEWAPAGTAATWTVSLSAQQNGAPAPAAAVTWTATGGLTLSSTSGLTGTDGSATVNVSSSVPTPGSASTVTGCVWTTFCATWTVFAVDPSQWQITVKAGAGQSVVPGETFAPLTLLITDLAGHPLAGASATIHQRVLASEGACAATGSCPAAPVLASSATAAVAASDGTVSVTPLQVSGQPQTVEIAISTGTVGFITLTLVVRP